MTDASFVKQGPLRTAIATLAIAAFVACWGSGYLAARVTTDYFEPFNLLFIRYVGTSLILAVALILVYRGSIVQALRDERISVQAVLGLLYHVVYIGCVFYAVKLGLSAGATALILATQPLVTVLLEAGVTHRWPGAHVIAGTLLCLIGSVLVIDRSGLGGLPLAAVFVASVGVAAICIATIVHARSVHHSRLLPSLLIQFFFGTAGVGALLLSGVEAIDIRFSWEATTFVFFLIFVTTLGSYSLMAWLIKTIPTSIYSNVFYLVPPAVMAAEYAIYGDVVRAVQLLGAGIVFLGIYIGFSRWRDTTVVLKKEELT